MVHGFFVMVFDVSERKISEIEAKDAKKAMEFLNESLERRVLERTEKLEEAKKAALRLASELKEALSTRERFLAVASHELRTPLTALVLRTELFRRAFESKAGGVADTLSRLRTIYEGQEREVERLVLLVNDMLDVSRIHSKQFSLTRERVELDTLVKRVVAGLQGRAAETGAPIVIERAEQVSGDWDEARLEQVVSNLI
jgi:signal transduction histidine kinase